jgi:hypothetical protein
MPRRYFVSEFRSQKTDERILLNNERYSGATSRDHSPVGNLPDNPRAGRGARGDDDIRRGF